MKIVRYFFVGAAAAAVDVGLFTIFAYWLHFNYLIVGACTFILATLVNYVLCVHYVFESGVRFTPRHEIAMVFLVSSIGLLVNQSVLLLMRKQLKSGQAARQDNGDGDGISLELLCASIYYLW